MKDPFNIMYFYPKFIYQNIQENNKNQTDPSTQSLINNLKFENQVRSIVINKSEDLDVKKLALENQE